MSSRVPSLLVHCTTLEALRLIRKAGHIKSPVWSVDATDPEAVAWALSHTYDRYGARHSYAITTFRATNARLWNIGHLPYRRVMFYECILDIPINDIVDVQVLRHYLAGRDPQIQALAAAIPAQTARAIEMHQIAGGPG